MNEQERFELELAVMLDLEFLRSNPSQEVIQQYAKDQVREAMLRDIRRARERRAAEEGEL
jgi:hypothetical protein